MCCPMTAAAAARDPSLLTVIADSPWADECLQLDHMASLPLGPLAIPAIPAMPYEPALVDALAGILTAGSWESLFTDVMPRSASLEC